MGKCLGKHSCCGSTFSIAILNGSCFLRTPSIGIVLAGDCKLNTIIIVEVSPIKNELKCLLQAILCALDELLGSGWVPNTTFFVAFGHDEEVTF